MAIIDMLSGSLSDVTSSVTTVRSADSQELSNFIYNELQKDFENVKNRISAPANRFNRDLADKLSVAIVQYLDTVYYPKWIEPVRQIAIRALSLPEQIPGPPGPPGPAGAVSIVVSPTPTPTSTSSTPTPTPTTTSPTPTPEATPEPTPTPTPEPTPTTSGTTGETTGTNPINTQF